MSDGGDRCCEEEKAYKEESGGDGELSLCRRVREGISSTMSFEEKYEGSAPVDTMQKGSPDGGYHGCKDLEMGVCLMCWRNTKMTKVVSERLNRKLVGKVI